MELELSFKDIKPLPLNMVYSTDFRTKRRFKSLKYKQFESQINLQLRKYKSQINKFNKKFNENTHYIVADYRFYYSIITKKDKRISKTSGDISNLIKALEDVVFKQLMADDSQIISVNAMKIESKEPRIEISYQLKSLNTIL